RSLEPDNRLDPGWGLRWIAVAPAAVIKLGTSLAARLLAHLREFLWRGVARIGATRLQQRSRNLAMALGAGELVDSLAMPIEPDPSEPVEDRVDGGLGRALAVGVLDPQ